MNIKRTELNENGLLLNLELQNEYGINVYWTKEDPLRKGKTAWESFLIASKDSLTYDDSNTGYLTIASSVMRNSDGQMLILSFRTAELIGISVLSSEGRSDALQIQSCAEGSIMKNYKELTISKAGKALIRLGYLRPKYIEYEK